MASPTAFIRVPSASTTASSGLHRLELLHLGLWQGELPVQAPAAPGAIDVFFAIGRVRRNQITRGRVVQSAEALLHLAPCEVLVTRVHPF
jgi:hypothetical protein